MAQLIEDNKRKLKRIKHFKTHLKSEPQTSFPKETFFLSKLCLTLSFSEPASFGIELNSLNLIVYHVPGDALWGILGCRNTSLKMYLPCVLYSENGQNEYILIIFSLTNIV